MRHGHIGRTHGEFSVARFYNNGGYDYVRRWIDVKEALEHALSLIASNTARSGMLTRIIITDGGDCTTWEWRHNEGVVFPPPVVKP